MVRVFLGVPEVRLSGHDSLQKRERETEIASTAGKQNWTQLVGVSCQNQLQQRDILLNFGNPNTNREVEKLVVK